MIELPEKKNVVLDATMLSTLQSCARLADFRFNGLWVAASGKSNSIECGSIAHAILEFYNKARIAGLDRMKAMQQGFDAGKEYITGFRETNLYITDENHQGVKNTPEVSDKKNIGWSYVIDTMEQYFDFWRNESWTIVGAEETRREVIYEDEQLRVMWKAKFDKIEDSPNGFISTDYKTMKQRRDTLSLNNQFMGQCVLLKSRNMLVDKIGWQTSLKAEEKFTRVLMSYSADRLLEWKNEIVPYYANMLLAYDGANNYPPNFTHCENKYGYCDFKEICESDRNMRDEVLTLNFVKGKVWDV